MLSELQRLACCAADRRLANKSLEQKTRARVRAKLGLVHVFLLNIAVGFERMKTKRVKTILIRIAIGILTCIVLLVAGFHTVFGLGFPPNKKGIAALRTWSKSTLGSREVYYLCQGMMDSTSIFRFSATQEEIDSFVRDATMHEVEHTGKSVYWPPFTRPYWFRPQYSPSNRLYHSPEHINDKWVLYYETESRKAYFVYFET